MTTTIIIIIIIIIIMTIAINVGKVVRDDSTANERIGRDLTTMMREVILITVTIMMIERR